jgi:hypothetical protein
MENITNYPLENQHRCQEFYYPDETIPFPEIQQIVREWEETFNKAFERTTLPDYPDFEKANTIVINARKAMLNK